MQKRFCSCGSPIWVHYLYPNRRCRILYSAEALGNMRSITRCSGCGEMIDIDTLH